MKALADFSIPSAEIVKPISGCHPAMAKEGAVMMQLMADAPPDSSSETGSQTPCHVLSGKSRLNSGVQLETPSLNNCH